MNQEGLWTMTFFKKIIFLINNTKIRKKIILIYIMVMFIPVMILGIYLTASMKNMVVERAVNEACINTDRIQDRLSEVLQKATLVSDRLYMDRKLHDTVLRKYENNWQVINYYSEYTAIDDYLRFYPEIESIRFYVDNKTMLDNSQFIKVTDEIKDSLWYKGARYADGRIIWQYKYDDISGQNYLSLSRVIKLETGNILGVLVINISNRYLNSIIKDEPFNTIAVVGNGKIVMSHNDKIRGTSTGIISSDIMADMVHNNIEKINYEGKKSIIITNTFSYEKTSNVFGIATIIPVENIVSKANTKIQLSLLIMVISLVISIGLIVLLSKLFSNRIILLRAEMRKVVNGDFNIGKIIDGNDEIGELYNDLNIMIGSIQQLIYEVYEQKIQKEQLGNRQREVEFKMLASQINPHFLYNTLETIRMKAHISKQNEIAHIVKMLAMLMRRNLNVGNSLVSLESEIELVKNYLEIQKFRFGERIHYKIDMLCDIKNYDILPLLLQPIVENAFIHGLENKEGQGNITIIIEKTDKNLVISVIDDGIGIEASQLLLINNKLNLPVSGINKSIGLSNVSQRIRLFYGENYFMKIDSEVNSGTKVCIFLPLESEGLPNVQGINHR
jgi:two-component system, sensor histidine kinase YesM